MKLYRNAVILAVIVGLLAGAYFYFKDKKQSSFTSDRGDIIRIFDLSTDKMTGMILENEDGTFVFEKETVKEKNDDGKEVERKVWVIKSPSDLKIDESRVNSIAINFSSLIADKIIEEEAADLAKYGLDKPVTVSVRMDDGTVKALEIGDKTPTGGAYYVKEKGGAKVYTIGSYTGERLKARKNDIRDKKLFSFASDDITGLSMHRGSSEIFAAEKTGEYEWTMLSPIQGNVNSSAVAPMLDAISQASVMNFIEENPADLGKYGLASPPYSFEFRTSAGKNKLLLGYEKEKNSEIYAKLADSNEVFTISLSSFTFLDKPLKEIIEVFAYIVNINDVDKITVEMDGYTAECKLETDKEDKDKDRFWVNGKEVTELKDDKDSQLFRKYYQALIGVTLSDVEVGAVPTGAPEITFTYYLKKEPGTMKVEFVPKDGSYYYVRRNGQYTGIIVAKKKFDEPEGVRDMYRKLTEALNK